MSINRSILVAVIISCSFSTYITYSFCKNRFKTLSAKITNEIPTPISEVSVQRMKGYDYIKPLLSVEKKKQSEALGNLKNNITNKIEEFKKSGVLMSASVYLRVFKKGEWISINDTESYYPGSLIKIAGLLTYLRMEEAHPGTLDKKLSLDSPKEFIPNQTFNSKQIEIGKSYTVRDLLKYMIVYSDNNATYLLNKNADSKMFQKLFTDLNLPLSGISNGNIKMNVKDCSMFFKVIYNSSYLSIDHSEFAAELLSQCDFMQGMEKGLPEKTKIAHKFGEMGDATTRQLHESGIIYIENRPYLLTVMTKGYDVTKLPSVISEITKLTYDDISNNSYFEDVPITTAGPTLEAQPIPITSSTK